MRVERGSWTDHWLQWIEDLEQKNPDLSPEELRKLCSREYPCWERSGWAYRSFLKALRHYFGDRAVPARAKAAGQADMFGG